MKLTSGSLFSLIGLRFGGEWFVILCILFLYDSRMKPSCSVHSMWFMMQNTPSIPTFKITSTRLVKLLMFKNKHAEKMNSPSGHPICIWVCFFIRFGEMYHSIICSAMDPLQWMGAVRIYNLNSWKKHQNIPHHSSLSVNVLWKKVKNCVFVRNKSIIKAFFTLNLHFLPKYDSIIPCCPSTSKSTVLTVRLVYGAYFSTNSDETFSMEESVLWIEDSYFIARMFRS